MSEEATDRGKHKAKKKKKKRICDKFQQQTPGSSGNSLTANQKQFVKGRCEILKFTVDTVRVLMRTVQSPKIFTLCLLISLKCHLDVRMDFKEPDSN